MTTRNARRTLRPPEVRLKTDDGACRRIEARLQFITPMFGGGVRLDPDAPHHKEPDRVTPVRGAALRGQLRAWWRRACCEGLPRETMKAREQVLWGWASDAKVGRKGLVSLSVDAGQLRAVPVKPMGLALEYGAFPLKPEQHAIHKEWGMLTEWKGHFVVSLELAGLPRSSSYRAAAAAAWEADIDLEALLWAEVERAWLAFVTFGGLGGRTRRGFGAVSVVDPVGPTLSSVVAKLGWQDRVAVLAGSLSNPERAHHQALSKLRDFRQGEGLGRNQGADTRRPGRSRWPEPDELRRITRRSDDAHKKALSVLPRFPRAAFGLPIIFHFQSRQDPGDTSLQPVGKERLASPLVLRPVEDATGVYGVALRLPGDDRLDTVLQRLQLRGRAQVLDGTLTPAQAAEVRPIGRVRTTRTGSAALFEAFFAHFKS